MGEFVIIAIAGALIFFAIKQYKADKYEYNQQNPKVVASKKLRYLGAAIMVFLAVVAYLDANNMSQNKPAASRTPKAEDLVKLTKWGWNKAGFGNVMMLSGKIVSAADYPVKDISITCTLDGNSGTSLGSVTQTIYETIPPKKSIALKNFNMGFIHNQASSANCEVTFYEKAGR